jgi:DNA replication protein DnaC
MIDDLGHEALLASRDVWAANWFFNFLDLRVRKGLPLIVTTNLDAKGLGNNYISGGGGGSDALVARIVEICEPIKF